MNITAKSRYALKIMMDLADCQNEGQQQRQKIATRQGVPIDYMDQIVAKLRKDGLVQSIRGRSGGFMLNKPASEISLWDIFSAVEESLFPVQCMNGEGQCMIEDSCISHNAWSEVFEVLKNSLQEKYLSELVNKWRLEQSSYFTIPASQSCRGPNRQTS